MEKSLTKNMQFEKRIHVDSLAIGIGWGWIGGLVGTLVMDLILIVILTIAGMPAFTCFSIVGETIMHFFLWQGMNNASVTQLGMAIHYGIGPIIGVIIGLLYVKRRTVLTISLKRSVLFAIIFVEILSQPLLVASPILLKMTSDIILLWYIGSTVMHLLAGVVLGSIIFYGFHLSKENK
jgi:hypothetical protein